MSERLNGFLMDEWTNQSAPRSQARAAPAMTDDQFKAIGERRAAGATTAADVDALLAEVRRLRGDRASGC